MKETPPVRHESDTGENSMDKPVILVVEDEAITALDIKRRLQRAGYTVPAIATSGEEALLQMPETQPDLVLMDIRLSGDMDGIQAAQAIRVRFDTPVVYLTAYADGETLQRAKATEPYGYLLKPFEEREVHTTVEMALHKHQMERKVRESQQWLSTTLRSIGDAVIATDAEGHVKLMNPVAESLTGWMQTETVGRDITDVVTVISEETGTPIDNPVLRVLGENQTVALGENCVLIAKDGTTVPIDDSAAPMRDATGVVVGAVMVFRDITERRRTEDALQQHARDLQARNRELDAFAHTVAHDLRDPLNLIIGFSDILEEDHVTMSDTELGEYLHLIARTGSRMNNIIDELLILAEVRQLDVEMTPLDMDRLVAAAQSRLAHVVEESQAEIICPDTWPVAVGYAPWVEEVWVNYLSNAIKHGGRPSRVELGSTEQGSMVRFWVQDNGPGVSPEDQDRLFRPFIRLAQARATGHGLGLSVVQRIVERLGGQVGVESNGVSGQGSLFYFVLPRGGSENAAGSARAQ